MRVYRYILEFRTHGPMKYYNLTNQLREIVEETGIETGILFIHAVGATPGLILINREYIDVFDGFIKELIPVTGWRHGNAYAHLRSTLTGTSLIIPVMDGKLWIRDGYGVFFIETRPVYNHWRRIIVFVKGV